MDLPLVDDGEPVHHVEMVLPGQAGHICVPNPGLGTLRTRFRIKSQLLKAVDLDPTSDKDLVIYSTFEKNDDSNPRA